MTTGGSALGLTFNNGVILAADKLGSYGSLARYRNVSRVIKVNDCMAMAAGGDFADFQMLKQRIEQLM